MVNDIAVVFGIVLLFLLWAVLACAVDTLAQKVGELEEDRDRDRRRP